MVAEEPLDDIEDDDDDDDIDERPRKRSFGAQVREFMRTWGPAILAVILIRTFVFEPFRIPSGSMVPTLLIGDHVLVTKFSYGIWMPFAGTELLDLGDPERGDIIVFKYPRDPSLNYIKRVVAIPGDKIRVQNNQILLDGEKQTMDYVGEYEFVDDNCRSHTTREWTETVGNVTHTALTKKGLGGILANHKEIEVPPDHVFVMGDNRDNSEDSRRWGFVRYDQIKGKAHFVWLSWDVCGGGGAGVANASDGGSRGGLSMIGEPRGDRFFHSLYQE